MSTVGDKKSEKSDKSVRKKIDELGEELAYLQRKSRELGIPVLIIVEGLSAAGKGTLINRIIQPLDPRGFKVSCIASPNRDEQLRPFLWRFWRRTPSADRMAIFDRSWYRNLLDSTINRTLQEDELIKAYADVRAFERQLRDGGTVFFKIFLDISKKEQASRLAAMQGNPATAWRVNDAVLARHTRYTDYKKAVETMFEETDDLNDSKWIKISAKDGRKAAAQAISRIVNGLSKRVSQEQANPSALHSVRRLPAFRSAPSLKNADLSLTLSKDTYREMLTVRQERIEYLHHELYRQRLPMVIVYEGWDASGKGGNIRRLTEEMDPRGYEVIPTAAPNDVEKAHHYLWRFWTEFPKAGHVTIFDRSWYGRVLVERVEGFCTEQDWKRAYREINEMEENFDHFGTAIVKFWIHIDRDEQLRRFQSRQENPKKRWKLHDEDWRNRDKWEPYKEAVEEMFLRTHTQYAPWTVIEGNCKRYARIKTLDVTIAAIEKKIAQKSK
ncbi:MAG: polyphosphate:AMP phosphotransferase [Verrucomicrobia bacterium TMED56]|nr:MAG: polyphosphate:AMP phosphotransferase [Verrucomicrobia bacterium TMED56]